MARGYARDGYVEELDPGTGWIYFAGLMLLLSGCFNLIDGIAALANSDYLSDRLQFANLHAWGWVFLIWGVVQIIAGIGIWMDAGWAAILGIVSAFLNLIVQLSWVRTNPFWAITVMVVDVLVIYGLVVWGGGRGERRAAKTET